jgi:CRISPR-associated endonuclease Csn1
METKNYRTVGEMLATEYTNERKRNHDDYKNVVHRDMVQDEAVQLFAAQRRFGAVYASEQMEQQYLEILLSQRSFDEGPGDGSPYGGNMIERMIGNCSLIEGEKRTAKASLSFERFNLLQNINHIRITQDGAERGLLSDERRMLIEQAHKKDKLTYADIRKLLQLPESAIFNICYGMDEIEAVEKKRKFSYLPQYHKIKKALGIIPYVDEMLDDIAYVLTVQKDDMRAKDALLQCGVASVHIEPLLDANTGFSKFGHISLKACRMINPYLEQGHTYNEACDAAGLDFKGYARGEKSKYLRYREIAELDDLTNPVARRAVSQTFKVINAIIREIGEQPAYIGIELAREMAMNKADRDKLDKSMRENQARNEGTKEEIKQGGVANPQGHDIVKMKLWKEQDGRCPYSLKPIERERLFEQGYAEVDHIVPYSVSFDDSYKNKVLVLAEENRRKGNRVPMQYLSGKARDDFEIWVKANIRDKAKRTRLLKESITTEDKKEFKSRHLNDTRYISRLMLNILQNYLELAPSAVGKKKQVIAVNGSSTAYIRRRWGISKIRADGDVHHAVDATVIACMTDGMNQRISRYSKKKELEYAGLVIDEETGEVWEDAKKGFPYPYEHFRDELMARVSSQSVELISKLKLNTYDTPEEATPIFVSRMPRRKSTGAAHKETISSPKMPGYTLKSVPLTSLKLDKDGEIASYYEKAKQSDPGLYYALLERMEEYNGNAQAAFAEGFMRPGWPDSHPPLQKIKIQEPSTLSVPVHKGKGTAANDSMVRIDVFHIEGDGYYFVPIYVADTLKDPLPNKAVVAYKKYEDWKDMRDEDFIFSVHPGELLKVASKRVLAFSHAQKDSTLPPKPPVQEELVYFVSAHIGTGAIQVKTHDGAYIISGVGIKTLVSLEKYTIDVLGSVSKNPVDKEKRLGFSKGDE